MNQFPSSWPDPVLTPDPTLQPAPQPGPGPLVPGPPTPFSGPQASPPMVSIRVNGDSFKLPRPLVALQVDADQNPTFATASKPIYHCVPPGGSLRGPAFKTGDQSRAHRLQPLANKHGKADVIAQMLKPGMNANATDITGLTALQNACRRGQIDEVKVLMAHSDVNSSAATTELTPTPLYIAAEEGHLELLNYLLQAGLDPNFQDIRNKRTALMAAAAKGSVEIMSRLLECEGLKLDLVCPNPNSIADPFNISKFTALHFALFNGKRDAMVCLLEKGAAFHMPTLYEGERSLLRWAIGQRDCHMVRLVLAQCAAGSGHGKVCGAAMTHAVRIKCAGIVECLLDAGLAGSESCHLVSLIHQASPRQGHTAAIDAVSKAEASRASVVAAGMAAPAQSNFDVMIYGLENYVPAIAIADLQLGCKRAPDLWTPTASALAAPLLAFNELFAPIVARILVPISPRESLLLHLHRKGMLMAVALPLAERIGACEQGLALLASAGQPVNAQQKAMYNAAALSALKPQEHSAAAARIYASVGINAKGAERLALAAQGQFDAVHKLASQVSALLGEQMLEQVIPACMKHTDGRYLVDVTGLAAALVASGLMRPFAQALAERWNAAVGSLMAGPVAIPPGASFAQVAQILDDALRRLGQTHFGASLQVALRDASLLAELRQMTSTAPTDEALPMLFQIQADQLRQFAEQLQQG